MTRVEMHFPRVDEAVGRLRELAARTPRLALRGAIGSGRSTLMRALVDSSDAGLRFVLLAPPSGADAALVGLAQLASQLDSTGSLVARLRDPSRPWRAKLDETTAALRDQAADTVLLVDQDVVAEAAHFATVFGRRSNELLEDVLAASSRRVVARSPWDPRDEHDVELVARTDVGELLAPERWGALADAARALVPHATVLATLSPLDVRLRVLLVQGGVAPRDAANLRVAPHEAVRRWLARLAEPTLVCEVLGALALVRTEFDESLLSRVHIDRLEAPQRAAVQHALLFGEGARLRLHETIAREARARGWPSDRIAAHRLVAAWHHDRFSAAAQLRQIEAATRNEIEEIHHLTEGGDAKTILERSVWFGEQYDALGKALSLQKRYADAVDAYGRAIELDAHDDYAQHYRAWNLDVQGRDAATVEEGYKAALAARAYHAWYHCRLVSFLITRGRVVEARASWDAALAELFRDGPAEAPEVYRKLHGEVARLLLHRGRLSFASDVLDDVTGEARREAWFDALRRLLEMLQEVERDEVVFPPSIAIEERWTRPHLGSGDSVVRAWMPGRVAGVDANEVHLQLGTHDRVEWRDVPIRQYRDLAGPRETPSAGTYVEWQTLEDGTERILTHRLTAFRESALPKLFPYPDRYLRNAP